MKSYDASRRLFLRSSGALSALGAVGAPFGLNLAVLGSAAAAATVPTDYRALVCVFLFGGNDTSNTVLPTDADSWARYQAARNQGTSPIALAAPGTAANSTAARGSPAWLGGVLPIVPRTPQAWPSGTTPSAGNRTFALHPQLSNLASLFGAGRLAVVANVGTLIQPTTKAQYTGRLVPLPRSLYSHNDQQSEWQAGAAEGARIGWGGRLGDMLASANGANGLFTAISTSGNAVMLAGNSVVQYQVAGSGAIAINGIGGTSLFGSTAGPAALRSIIGTATGASLFQSDYGTVVDRSISAELTLNSALNGVTVPTATQYTDPINGTLTNNPLAQQLQTVARIIAASGSLGVKRQVFFVSIGGFDTHAGQNTIQPNLMAQIDHGLNYFYSTMQGLNLQNNVTAFTMSDFGRTFTTNGLGTDHAWGAHHLVLGGAVKGGDIYGQFPTVGVDLPGGFTNPNAVGSGALIPGISVDQYAATLGNWFGASATDLASIFPNLANFATTNLGFV